MPAELFQEAIQNLSVLELTWRGQNPLSLSNGEERFIEDNDITMKAWAEKDG
jgi:fumarylacetoacetase